MSDLQLLFTAMSVLTNNKSDLTEQQLVTRKAGMNILGSENMHQEFVGGLLLDAGLTQNALGYEIKLKGHQSSDVVIFSDDLVVDHTPPDKDEMCKHARVVIEIKTANAGGGAIKVDGPDSVNNDIEKLADLSKHMASKGTEIAPVMMVFDTGDKPNQLEQNRKLDDIKETANTENVYFLYVGATLARWYIPEGINETGNLR